MMEGMRDITRRVDLIIQERAEQREQKRNDLIQAITQAGSTEAYLSEQYPRLAKMAGSLTPEQLVSVVDEEEAMYYIEHHIKRCQECSDGSKCWDFDFDPYQGTILEMEDGLLIESVCDKFEEYGEARALSGAGVGKRFLGCSLDNYAPITADQTKALKTIKEYSENLLTEDAITDKGLLIVGPVGTGKTHLAVGVLREAYRLGSSIAFAQVPQVLAEIRAGIGRGDEEAASQIEMYGEVSVLALDDLGSERVTDWVREQLFLIINRRYEEMLPTIITSNDSLEGLEAHVGQRIASRLAGMCIGVALDGPDYRLGGEQ